MEKITEYLYGQRLNLFFCAGTSSAVTCPLNSILNVITQTWPLHHLKCNEPVHIIEHATILVWNE